MRGTSQLVAVVACMPLWCPGAVDETKFRTCDQTSFCRRYRRWIDRPNADEALWLVVPGSREPSPDGGLSYLVRHRHEAAASCRLRLNVFRAGALRFRLSELEPLHPRYEAPPGDVVVEPLPEQLSEAEVEELPDASVAAFRTDRGDRVVATLEHAPLALRLEVNGEVVQRLNARNGLNLERYRRRPAGGAAAAGDPARTLDAAAWPGADREGLWEEAFGPHLDSKPRGPAAVGVDVAFAGDVGGVFGLPEHACPSRLEGCGEPYRCFNLDVCEYELHSPMALYGAVPVLHAVRRAAEGLRVSAFLWLNPSDTFVQLERAEPGARSGPMHAWFASESGVLDAVLLSGPSPRDAMRQFHLLTGFAPLPPLWSLGKHQSRWNYEDEEDVRQVNGGYDEHGIPLDAVWLDIEHTDGKRYFTWDPQRFPDPRGMARALSASGRKLVTIVDPHVKKDEGYELYRRVVDAGLCVQAPGAGAARGGEPARGPRSAPATFEGWCWPGTSVYPDFTDPRMRRLWAGRFSLAAYAGSTADVFTWNDMNEPSVFNGPEVTCPRDAVHPCGGVEHRDVHNLYGMYVQRASFEGLLQRDPQARPFVLSRSFFAGSHRWGAVWTGDNRASWEHLAISVPMLTSLALAGHSFAGADVGGFFGHPGAELLVRWYQFGALAYPFFRQHAHEHSPRREPWLWDAAALRRIRRAVRTRYELLPYLYAAFEAFHREGLPVLAPLWWHFPGDPAALESRAAAEESLMVGDALLVRCVHRPLAEQRAAPVHLPRHAGGGWYGLRGGAFLAPGPRELALDLEDVPAFWRGGSIVPTKRRARPSTARAAADPFTLAVFLDAAAEAARGVVYVDDGASRRHARGDFLRATLEFSGGVLRRTEVRGGLSANVSTLVERVEVHGLERAPSSVVLQVAGEEAVHLTPAVRSIERLGAPDSGSAPLHMMEVAGLSIDLNGGAAWSLCVDCSGAGGPKAVAGGPQASRRRASSGARVRVRQTGRCAMPHEQGLHRWTPASVPGLMAGLFAGAWRGAARSSMTVRR